LPLTFVDQGTTMTKSRAQKQREKNKDDKVKIPISIFDLEDFYNWYKDIEVYLQGKEVLGVK
jgi:hypothetical protein